ncbi:MAG: diguanylate cyclase [Nitriliruptoraceae bacterium]
MSRESLSERTHRVLINATHRLADTAIRRATLTGGVIVVLALHLLTGDARFAFAAVPLIFLAGVAGSNRLPLIIAGIAAFGHTAIDVAAGASAADVFGLVVRALVFTLVAAVGLAEQHLEREHDRAVHRAVEEDSVTGLLNVRAFYDTLGALCDQKEEFTILLADIRGMKALNDRHGHPTGTEAMRVFAQALRREIPTAAKASRLGSDEIAIALPKVADAEVALISERILERLRNELIALPDGTESEVKVAFGIAHYPTDATSIIGVLRAADNAKEAAKRANPL